MRIREVSKLFNAKVLARMIRESGIDFKALPDEQFDPVFGDSTGAPIIFGATGGVREAEISAGNMKIKAAVAHGLGNARKLLDMVKTGEK